MKFVILMSLLVSAQSYAAGICKFEETWEFAEAHQEVSKSKDHSAFTVVEKKMIHEAVTIQEMFGDLTLAEALEHFGDYNERTGETGSNAGAITYFNVNGKTAALVTYYPGDNEYGALFEVNGKSFKMVGVVEDSFIECK